MRRQVAWGTADVGGAADVGGTVEVGAAAVVDVVSADEDVVDAAACRTSARCEDPQPAASVAASVNTTPTRLALRDACNMRPPELRPAPADRSHLEATVPSPMCCESVVANRKTIRND